MIDDQPIPPAPKSENDPNHDAAHPSNVVFEMKVPPSHAGYKIACKKKRDKWDIAKLVAEFVGLGFLILYTLFTAGIYCANLYTLQEIRKQTTLIYQQQRPWISVTNSCFIVTKLGKSCPAGPPEHPDFFKDILADNPSTAVTAQIQVMNTGLAPAFHVTYITHWKPWPDSDDVSIPPVPECEQSAPPQGTAEKYPLYARDEGRAGTDDAQLEFMPKSMIDEITSNPPKSYFYEIGCIFYKEWQGVEWHRAKFCLYYAPHQSAYYRYCTRPDSNSAD